MIKATGTILLAFFTLLLHAQTFSLLTNTSGINKVGSTPTNFLTIGPITYFTANDGIKGTELWKTDGTASGTVLVKDINQGKNSSSPYYLTNLNGILIFAADNGINGSELWRSDGTDAGTTMIADVYPGIINGIPKGMHRTDLGRDSYTPIVVNSIMYFMGANPSTGIEVWKTDGTGTGTTIVKDIFAGTSFYSGNGYFCNWNGSLYFSYNDNVSGYQIWKSDGSANGTVRITNSSLSVPSYLTATSSFLFFTDGQNLWRTNGTPTGTVQIGTFNSISGSTLIAADNYVYYSANSSTYGFELWRSDGVNASTTSLVKDINPGSESSAPASVTRVASTIYFTAYSVDYGRELWKTNITDTTAIMVKDFFSGVSSSFSGGNADIFNIDNTLYFKAEDETNGTELWTSDGTSAGTVNIKNIASVNQVVSLPLLQQHLTAFTFLQQMGLMGVNFGKAMEQQMELFY